MNLFNNLFVDKKRCCIIFMNHGPELKIKGRMAFDPKAKGEGFNSKKILNKKIWDQSDCPKAAAHKNANVKT